MHTLLPTFLRRALAGAVFVAATFSALAGEDYYATPTGAGAQDGTSWANAWPQAQIQSAVNGLAAGDTLNLGSGTYTITSLVINSSGAAGNPKTILGVDTGGGRPLFQGTFNVANDASGAKFMSFPGAAHYWVFKNLSFRNQPWTISMALVSSGDDTLRSNLVFDTLSFDYVEDGIRLYNANHVQVINCTAIRYTKKAFRMGDHTSFLTFRACSADCTGGDPSFVAKAIPVGFGGDDTDGLPIIHDIDLIDCSASNNGYPQGSSNYWNGDGFSTERGTYNVKFVRCQAFGNNDGGFDNKADNILYQDCVSVGNSRGFRHWAADGQMVNCLAAYNVKFGGTGGAYGVWVSGNGGGLNVDYSTFHGLGTALIVDSGGVLSVNNSILSADGSITNFVSGSATLNQTVTWSQSTGTDPQYVARDPLWRGVPANAMDSQLYGLTKGYSSARVDPTPNSAPTLAIAATTTSGLVPLPVSFTADAADSDGTLVGFAWTFGDGQSSTQQNPTITYYTPGTFTVTCTVTDNRGAKTTQTLTVTASMPTMPVAMRIETGSATAYTNGLGQVWAADFGFTGGGMSDRGAIEIAGTNDDRLYQTERWGVTGYSFIVANGLYEVRLHMAETYSGITAAGQRVFSVTAEGTTPAGWTNIDIFAEAGGRDIAFVKSGIVAVTDNYLDLSFAASVNNTLINAIEILPAAGGDMPPAPPSGLSFGSATTNSFTVSWVPATDDVGVVSYDVFRDGVFVGSTTGLSLPVTGLAPYTSYQINVRARDTAGNGSVLSAPLYARTLDDGSAGGEIIIDNAAPLSVTLTGTWTVGTVSTTYYGTNYLHDGNIDKGTKSARFTPDIPVAATYSVYVRWPAGSNRANNVPIDVVHASGTTTKTFNQRVSDGVWVLHGTYALAAGTGNSVLIRTTGTNGFVMADAVRFLREAPDTTAPAAPTGLAASSVLTDSFTLSWTAAIDDVGVSGYEVFINGVSRGAVTSTSASVTGLSPSTTYTATVRARDAAGNWSALSSALNVTTATPADTIAPSTPTGLVANNVGTASFILSWTASTDNLGVTAYEVFRDATSLGTTATTNFSVTGLAANTNYAMTVRARDAAGNWSVASTALSVTTQASSGGGGTTVNGRVISVNVGDGTNSLTPDEIAGAVPAANWNNSASANQAVPNAPDDLGAATTADVTFTNASFGYLTATTGTSGDAKMMRSQRGLSNGSTMTASVAQVPYATYDVYVYWGGRTTQESVPATMTVNFQQWNGTAWVTTATKYIKDTNRTWDGTYNESTATVATEAVDGNEYVVFRAATDATFRISATLGSRAGISGFQIVEQVAPPPATAPSITSATTANGVFGTPFSYAIAATQSPTSFAATGLPAGLSLDSATGLISGAPAAAGVFDIALSATNAGGTGSAVLTLTVARAMQAITFPHPGAKTYGDAPLTLAATASSGLPVAYAVTSGPATLSDNVLTLIGAGTVVVSATQTGSTNYQPATPVEISISVAKAAQTIDVDAPEEKTYGDVAFVVNATASSSLPVTLEVESGPATVSGNLVTILGAGPVTLTASQPGNDDFLAAAPVSVAFDVAQASQTITFAAPAPKTFGDAPFSVEAIASSHLPVVYSVVSGPATIAGNLVTITGAGAVTLVAEQAGNGNYLAAESVTISFEVAKAAQTITFPNPGAKTFGDAPFALAATASSGLPVSYAVSSGPATVSGATVTLTGAGTVTLIAVQAGDGNHLAGEPVSISFPVAPANATIVLSALWQLYDGTPKTVVATTTPADLQVTITYDGSAPPPTYPGSFAVEATLNETNYTASATGTLVIATGLTVRHAPTLNGTVDGSVQVLSTESMTLNGSANISGDLLVPGTPAVQLNGQPNFGGAVNAPGQAGATNYTVTLNGGASLRHLVRRVDASTLPVVTAPPTPTGTRDVSLNNATQDPGDFATLRNLTLNSNAGVRAIPPGTYGSFTANGSSGFVLGVAGTTTPSVYQLQSLTLNGNSRVQLAGPVMLVLANGTSLNGTVGTVGSPELLLVRIVSGGLTLNGGAALHGFLEAPNGNLTVNGNSTLHGGIAVDRLTVNGGASLRGPEQD